jgi:hypothetical protein
MLISVVVRGGRNFRAGNVQKLPPCGSQPDRQIRHSHTESFFRFRIEEKLMKVSP